MYNNIVLGFCSLVANDTIDVGATPTVALGEESSASAAPQHSTFLATIVSIALGNGQDEDTSGTTGTTAAPIVEVNMVPDGAHIVRTVVVSTCSYHVQTFWLFNISS